MCNFTSFLSDPEVVPIGGYVGTYIHEEDSAAVPSVSTYAYQPYTLTYAAPTGNSVHSGAGGMGPAFEGGALLGGASVDPETKLIRGLRSGAELRATVRAWAASTSTSVVRGLSPQSLQRILQSISFSMDQVTVAHELAQVIHCTCAHVVTAVNTCSFFKTEIASGMVPYVRDAETRNIVLSLLPTYDREKIEMLFVKA